MLYAVISLCAALLLLLAVLLLRTLRFKPQADAPRTPTHTDFDGDKAVRDLAAMIQCRTVSDRDPAKEDAAEFEKFIKLLPTLFPRVYAACEQIETGERSLLLRWRGESPDEPLVLMSHFDVVSVVEEDWTHPAFGGVVENGILWGRGTLDTKATLNGILQAAETLLQNGFTPKRDVFLAFSGNEEVSGNGAPAIVDWLEKNNITPWAVIDEGGAVVENVFPGVSRPCAMVGIAEKGLMNLEFSIKTNGGHSSEPPRNTSVGILSKACVRVEANPFPFRLTPAALRTFDTLGRHSTFLYRVIFANLWLFRPVLDRMCRKSGGQLNALVRTTVAFTQMEGSKGMNVLPPKARMLANLRLVSGDTVESAVERIRRTIKDERITLTPIQGRNPSRVSTTDCEAWVSLKNAIADTWQGVLVCPHLMVACTDSRHYGRISDRVYRFSPLALSKAERGGIHGNDEHIPLKTLTTVVEFYLRILQSM